MNKKTLPEMKAAQVQPAKPGSHLPFLDALRGLMALWVVAGHSLGAMGGFLLPLSHPGSAVDVFMLVSGFLMAYYFRVRETKEPWESPLTWRNFYIRRFFRIAPAYYLLLLAALVFRSPLQGWEHETFARFSTIHYRPHVAEHPAPLLWSDVLAHLTFTFGFVPAYAASNALPDWSIGLEMQFYMALPFIMLLYRRAGHIASTAILMLLWVAANHWMASGPDATPRLLGAFPMASFLPLKLNCFVVGILLAEAFHWKATDSRRSLLLCMASLLLVRLTFDKYAAVVACISGVMLIYRGEMAPAVVGQAFTGVRRFFESRFFTFLADTSYGVYLFHLLVLWPFASWLAQQPGFGDLGPLERSSILFGMTTLVAYPVATLLHHYVELPGIEFGKKFITRPQLANAIQKGGPVGIISPRQAMEYTVIIPTHNRPDLVVRAIRSVQTQTVPPREILVIDDASTPPLVLPAEVAENGVRVIRHVLSAGGAVARNSGLAAASTDIVAFLDDDDEWLPRKMEIQLAWLADHPEAALVSCGHLRHEGGCEYHEVFTQKFVERYHQYDNYFGSFSYLVIRQSRAGVRLDAGMPALQDWDFALRAVRGRCFGVIEQALVKYYAHDLPRITNRRGNHLRGLRRCYLKHRSQFSDDARRWLLSRIVFERTREVTSPGRRFARVIFSLTLASGCRLPFEVKYRSIGRRAASLILTPGTIARLRSLMIATLQNLWSGRVESPAYKQANVNY